MTIYYILHIKGHDMTTTTYSVRIDSDLKIQAESIYGAMGQTLSSAINAFLLQSVRVGGFPFEMRLSPNERDTILAMIEANGMLEHPQNSDFIDAESLLAELNK